MYPCLFAETLCLNIYVINKLRRGKIGSYEDGDVECYNN